MGNRNTIVLCSFLEMSAASDAIKSAEGGAPRMAPLEKYLSCSFPLRFRYKLVFLGDPGVGKTSIITRFMYDTFDSSYQVFILTSETNLIGNDWYRFPLKNNVFGGPYYSSAALGYSRSRVGFLWVCNGRRRFRSLIPSYIRDSSVAVIVYDLTSAEWKYFLIL